MDVPLNVVRRSQRASQKPSTASSNADGNAFDLRPARIASSATVAGAAATSLRRLPLLKGMRSSPGTIPATSQRLAHLDHRDHRWCLDRHGARDLLRRSAVAWGTLGCRCRAKVACPAACPHRSTSRHGTTTLFAGRDDKRSPMDGAIRPNLRQRHRRRANKGRRAVALVDLWARGRGMRPWRGNDKPKGAHADS